MEEVLGVLPYLHDNILTIISQVKAAKAVYRILFYWILWINQRMTRGRPVESTNKLENDTGRPIGFSRTTRRSSP